MEIKEILTIDDLVDTRIDVLQRSDFLKHSINKRRIYYFVLVFINITCLFIAIPRMYSAIILSCSACLAWCFFEMIVIKKRYINYNKKNIKRNIEITAKQYDLSLNEIESITKIENDKIIMEQQGTSIIYLKSDYLGNTENEKSYILNFTKGRFIYLKKTSFPTKESYKHFINDVSNKFA